MSSQVRPQVAKRTAAIFNGTGIRAAIWLSAGFHLLLVILLVKHCSIDLIEFWAFFVCDVILWTLALIPLIAVIRGYLQWFDPISLLSVFFFGMVGAFYPAYIADPEFVKIFSAYGGYALQYNSEPEFLSLVIQAELILGTFWTFMLVINRRRLEFTPSKFTKDEYKAALWTSATCLIGGIVGFFSYWHLESFLRTITVNLGKPASMPERGTSRYLILVFIATTSVSLGLVGWLKLKRRSKNQRYLSHWVVVLPGLAVALVHLWNGAREEVLFAFLFLFIIVSLFGFKIKRATWLIAGILCAILLGLMTIIRGNIYLADTPGNVISQVLSGEARQSYRYLIGSDVGTLLGLDRVGVVAMVLDYQKTKGNYLYGESLAAGPVNLAAEWMSRITGKRALQTDVLRMASEIITLWRFGFAAYGGVPPSFPGEFFMQSGILSFLILSFVFSKIFLWLRRKVAKSESLIGRWTFCTIALTVTKLASAEISPFFDTFIYYILPILIIYGLVMAMLKTPSRSRYEMRAR